jgi:hypothetical protein
MSLKIIAREVCMDRSARKWRTRTLLMSAVSSILLHLKAENETKQSGVCSYYGSGHCVRIMDGATSTGEAKKHG